MDKGVSTIYDWISKKQKNDNLSLRSSDGVTYRNSSISMEFRH